MPKPKLDDLAAFQEWLIETYSISNKSASVYASRVRKILNEVDEISESSLNNFIESVSHTSSLDLFLSAWNKFVAFLLEEKFYQIPMAKRPTKEKRNIKIKPHNSLLELAYFLKMTVSISYTKMLTFTWADVKTTQAEYWEIVDPVEFGTYYKVPRSLLQDAADFIFGDYPINPRTPLFLGNVHHRKKLSRSMLSMGLQDFQPSFQVQRLEDKPAPIIIPKKKDSDLTMLEEIEIPISDTQPEIPDILNDYSMFDPDKF